MEKDGAFAAETRKPRRKDKQISVQSFTRSHPEAGAARRGTSPNAADYTDKERDPFTLRGIPRRLRWLGMTGLLAQLEHAQNRRLRAFAQRLGEHDFGLH